MAVSNAVVSCINNEQWDGEMVIEEMAQCLLLWIWHNA